MAHLGDFGKPVGPIVAPEDPDTIGLGDPKVVVRLRPVEAVSMFPMMEFARLLSLGIPAKDVASLSTAYGVLESSVLPDDFWILRTAISTVGNEGVVELVFALYERWSKVPLAASPGSSDGQSSDPEKPSPSSVRRPRRARQPVRSAEDRQAELESIVLGTE